MNILFLIPSLANGGQEKAGMILCNYLLQFYQVTVVCLEAPAENEFDYHPEVIRIILTKKKSFAGKLLNGLKRINALKKIKRRLKPDVSIAFGNTAVILNAFTKGNETKIASVRQSLNGSTGRRPLSARIQQWIYGLALKRSDRIVPVSNDINLQLKELFKIYNQLFIPNGIDAKDIEDKSKETLPLGWNTFFNDHTIAHMGRFDSSKCNWQLVKIFSLVKQQLPSAKLLLLGGIDYSNPVNERIYNFCIHYLQEQNLKVAFFEKEYTQDELRAADVLVAGHQFNPFPLLSKAAVFAFPSAWEGFPNAILEAMALGLAVVSADCATGPRDILAGAGPNEQYGYLLPVFDQPFNEKDGGTGDVHFVWASTIVNLLNDRKQLSRFAELSATRAAVFDHAASNKKWKDIIASR